MKPKDIFGLLIRAIGLLFIYQGLASLPVAVGNFCGVFILTFRVLFSNGVMVCWPLIVGFLLIQAAPWLIRWAYPAEDSTRNSPPV
jgi:hypothetical protein